MKFIFICFFLTSIQAYALTNYESAAIGCRGISSGYKLKVKSSIHVLNSVLLNPAFGTESEIVDQHIEAQIKHWIGISKEYRSIHISKLAISAYRSGFEILASQLKTVTLPKLDIYWGNNIHLGQDPYVKQLLNFSEQSVVVKKIDYQTDILITACGVLPLSEETLFHEIENLEYPIDPFLSFWINGPQERRVIMTKNGKLGLVPDCLSQDFLIFGTSPDYGWFYWQPVHRDRARLCRINDAMQVTRFEILAADRIKMDKSTKLFADISSNQVSMAAAFGQVSDSKRTLTKTYDVLYSDIAKIFSQCAGAKDSLNCFSELDRYLLVGRYDLDPGQTSMIYVLKFYSAMVSDHKIVADRIDKNFILFKLQGLSRFDQKQVTFSIYGGPTGVFKSYQAPEQYWNFVLKALHEDDLFLYFGHAGVGKNLALKNILERATIKKNSLIKRTKDLNIGLFNCEAHSYFGWDLNPLFATNDSGTNFVNLVASSGVEVSSSFVSGYIENILKSSDLKVETMIENMSGYVLTDDFLMFQKIPTY